MAEENTWLPYPDGMTVVPCPHCGERVENRPSPSLIHWRDSESCPGPTRYTVPFLVLSGWVAADSHKGRDLDLQSPKRLVGERLRIEVTGSSDPDSVPIEYLHLFKMSGYSFGQALEAWEGPIPTGIFLFGPRSLFLDAAFHSKRRKVQDLIGAIALGQETSEISPLDHQPPRWETFVARGLEWLRRRMEEAPLAGEETVIPESWSDAALPE